MKRTKVCLALTLSFSLVFFLASAVWAQIDVGNFSISGGAEVGGLPRGKTGKDTSFETYRDLPESAIVPQLQLMIGGKKEDFYLNFDSSKLGLSDQNYILRFGRYGLVDVEFEWDQFPHLFSSDTARTPYSRDGDGGTFTLSSKSSSTSGTVFRDWLNSSASDVDLKLFNGIGRFKVRYTPTPGWTFTSSYWSQNSSGKRAFGAIIGPSPGRVTINELTEPLDYQTHNIELGGEYAGNGWSVGLRYNASLFHNNVSTLVWDNPVNLTGTGSACTEAANFRADTTTGTDSNRGPCRGRIDLYPSNQAHTWTLSGASTLPFKSNFMGTVSYGVRFQNDPFLPITINSAATQIALPRSSLDGDVRPLMVNATLVNRYFDHLDLKAYYRLYDLDNRSKEVTFSSGYVLNDSDAPRDVGLKTEVFAYSKQNLGLEGGYNFTRWLTAKLGYGWERIHREHREVLNADEHTIGPTLDIKPFSWLLFRGSYKHSWRNSPGYDPNKEEVHDAANILRKVDEATRDRDRSSLFAQITPWDRLMLYSGFEFTSDRYPESVLGTQNDFNYSPSLGAAYMPSDWVKLFWDYNWERYDWKMEALNSSSPATPASAPTRVWFSRGRDQIHTLTFGSDMDLIQKLLGFRFQYGFSVGKSLVRASGNSGGTAATNYPAITNTWHEFLARFEYQLHKNVALRFGYYFNRVTENDAGVDIMKPWMGDVDSSANVQRSIFLGDKVKSPFNAHVGFLTLKLSF